MTNSKQEQELEFREEEMVKKLSELFGKLEKSKIELQEKFDIFRSYFRGIQDGFFIALRSIGTEPTEDQRPIIELRINAIINNVESGRNDVNYPRLKAGACQQ